MPSTPPAAPGASSRWTLVVVCGALATVVSAVAALNVAVPSLARDVRATHTELAWVIDAYALVFAALLLPCGALGDRYGRRRALLAGLTIFGCAAVGAMIASDVGWLIGMRALLGVGAALVMPATLSTITSAFQGAERVRAVGAWAGIAGASAILGLLASGLILEVASWRGVFAFHATMAVVSVLGVLRSVPESADAHTPPLDRTGTVLSVTGLGVLVYGVIEAPVQGWGSASTLAALALGAILLVAFTLWELHVENPLLDPRLFRRRAFAAGSLTITSQFFAFFGFIFVTLQYLQLVQGHSPLDAAVRMLPLALGLMPAARVVGPTLSRRVGSGAVSVGGLALAAAALAALTLVEAQTPFWALSIAFLTLGIGMGLAMTPATAAITDALPPEQQGVGSAVNDLARELGGALGIAVLSSVLLSTYRSAFDGAGLSGPANQSAEDSPALAMQLGPEVARDAELAFVGAMQAVFATAAFVLVAAAVVTAYLVRGLHGPRGREVDVPSRPRER